MFDWIAGVIDSIGYAGVAALMFAENLFPPIPSELIMPLAGFQAARGQMTLIGVLIAGAFGSVAGAVAWYWVGRGFKARRLKELAERHGRWLTITAEDVDRASNWFDRHGPAAVLFGRLVPTVRTFISVPAGIARMPFWKFLAYSTFGTAVWTAILGVAGYLLQSQYDRVAHLLDPVSVVVITGLVGWYLYRVVTYGRRKY